jgi:hypothetical protein
MNPDLGSHRNVSRSSLRRRIRIELKANINPYGDASGRCQLAGPGWSCGWHVVGLTMSMVRTAATRHRTHHEDDAIFNNQGRLRPYPPPRRFTEKLQPLEDYL